MACTFRPATNADCAEVERLVFGVLAEYGLRTDPDGLDADLREIERTYLAGGGAFDVLVDEDGRIVGTVGLSPVDEKTCELRKMYVAKERRGAGLGKRLLERALARAAALGFRRVVLETAEVLEAAVALYERHGFRRYMPDHLGVRCDAAYYLNLDERPPEVRPPQEV